MASSQSSPRISRSPPVAAYPSYADYQAKTDRDIPVFLVERRD